MRTTAPSQTKTFAGLDFCKRCYDALELVDLSKKEVEGYFKSLSTEDTARLFEALVTIASKFHKKERESILLRCIQAIGGEAILPEGILAFSLAALALQESSGTEPLTRIGELTLLNVSSRLARELTNRDDELPDSLSELELLDFGSTLLKNDYDICIDVFNQLEPSEYTEPIKEELSNERKALDSMGTTLDVNLPAVKEGIYLECSEDTIDSLLFELGEIDLEELEDIDLEEIEDTDQEEIEDTDQEEIEDTDQEELEDTDQEELEDTDQEELEDTDQEEIEEKLEEEPEDELAAEYVLQGWKELTDTLKEMEEDFVYDGIQLNITEEDYDAPIYLLIDCDMLYITTEWEKTKAVFSSQDIDAFMSIQEEMPLFVIEKAAGGIEPLQEFLGTVITQHDNKELIYLYTYLLTEQGKSEEAVQFMEKIVSDAPDNSAYLLELAVLKSATGTPKEAITLYQRIEELEPENWLIPAAMGNIYENMGDFNRAKASYKRALELSPQNPYLMSMLTRTETAVVFSLIEEIFSQKDYEKALKIIDEHFDPFDVDVFHYYKGQVLARMGRLKEALAIMTDYVDIFPRDEDGWLEEASIYLDLHQFAAAARCFRRCAVLNPTDIHPIVWEAFCYKRLGKSRNYKRCINQAKKIDPEGTKALLKEFRF
jgi:tetratricopeptide (TPR) repeat protein